MTHAVRGWGGVAWPWVVLAAWLAVATLAWGGDVTTLAGVTFHEVRLVRVEPDGVTWEHATGMVKVDFTDLPDAVRRQYHYDAGKAAAFAAVQAQALQQAAVQTQQVQREAAARREQRFQGRSAAASGVEGELGAFVYRRRAADAAAVESVRAGIAAKQAAETFRTKDDGTIMDRRLWAVPVFLFGRSEFNGIAFDPKTDFNSHEFRSGAYHAPGGFAPTSKDDAFFEPIYMTKSYNDEVDRAAAFARGKP